MPWIYVAESPKPPHKCHQPFTTHHPDGSIWKCPEEGCGKQYRLVGRRNSSGALVWSGELRGIERVLNDSGYRYGP